MDKIVFNIVSLILNYKFLNYEFLRAKVCIISEITKLIVVKPAEEGRFYRRLSMYNERLSV